MEVMADITSTPVLKLTLPEKYFHSQGGLLPSNSALLNMLFISGANILPPKVVVILHPDSAQISFSFQSVLICHYLFMMCSGIPSSLRTSALLSLNLGFAFKMHFQDIVTRLGTVTQRKFSLSVLVFPSEVRTPPW